MTATAEQRTNTFFFRVMESAPPMLLICAALGLAIVGVFQYIFYLHVLPAAWHTTLLHTLSGAIAIFFEALGFYFLVATVRDFSGGHRREGYIGLLATFLLWGYALFEAHHIAVSFDAGGQYWSVFGIIGTIVCIVRVVELRITLTVTSAYQQTNAIATLTAALEAKQELTETLTGKLARYQAEEKEAEQRKQQAEQAEAQRIAAQREQEIEAMFRENETLRRRIATQEKKTAGVLGAVTQDAALRVAREFMRKNPRIKPTQSTIAQLMQKTERTVRSAFPNGSWDDQIEQLFREINQAQPEAAH